MKKHTILVLCLLMIWSVGLAQKERRSENRDKIRALKIAYITDKLSLTSKEAEKFWPLYNEHEKSIEKLRMVEKKIMRKRVLQSEGFASMTEKDSSEMLADIMLAEKEIFLARQQFRNKLKKVLSSKKILSLEFAERSFKQQMFKRLRSMKKRTLKE